MIHLGMGARVGVHAERPSTFFICTTGGAGQCPEACHRDPEEKEHYVGWALLGLSRTWAGHAVSR